jgi:hypothetical protein
MSAVSPVPFESLTALSVAVDEHLADRGPQTRATAFSLCIEAVAFGREGDAGLDPDLVGVRSRSSGYLLLERSCPELSLEALDLLAAACERAALGRSA